MFIINSNRAKIDFHSVAFITHMDVVEWLRILNSEMKNAIFF